MLQQPPQNRSTAGVISPQPGQRGGSAKSSSQPPAARTPRKAPAWIIDPLSASPGVPQEDMADPLFDEPARRQRRQRALSRDPRPFMAERIIDEWLERLEPVSRRFGQVLVTGVPAALQPAPRQVGDQVRVRRYDRRAGRERRPQASTSSW